MIHNPNDTKAMPTTTTQPALAPPPLFGLVWEQVEPSVGAIYHNGKLGDWIVARVGWSVTRSDDGPYNARLFLPGLKTDLAKQFPTVEAAQEKLTAAVTMWIRRAGLCPNAELTHQQGEQG